MPIDADNADAAWMDRAISLAMLGRGKVEPNPMVGCVIVRGGIVLGEGRHEYYGGPHAEPNALGACKADREGAIAYVTLEPCCHTDKQTPPCVPRLIAAKLARVVIGCLDPNPRVAGRGVSELAANGIAVTVGAQEKRARQLNAAYLMRVLEGRPYVTLKWAESADGRVAGPGGERRAISNLTSLAAVHGLRSRCDAIVVGIQTVQSDDPLLTARGVSEARPLLRVVIDPQLRLLPESQLAKTAHLSPVIAYCTSRTFATCPLAVAALRARRIEVVPLDGDERHFQLIDLLHDLHQRRATHVLVEPGPNLAAAFFRENLADRVWRICSPDRIGHPAAPSAAEIPFEPLASMDLKGDRLMEYLNPRSPAYYAPETSADWELLKLVP